MKREWEPEELIACWTLVYADRRLVANKSGATRLGFAVLLKFFELRCCVIVLASLTNGCRRHRRAHPSHASSMSCACSVGTR